MIDISNPNLTYEKEVFAICIPQRSRFDWSCRVPVRRLSGARGSWHLLERVTSIEAIDVTWRRKILHLALLLPCSARAERAVYASRPRWPVPLHDSIQRERNARAANTSCRPAFPGQHAASAGAACAGDEGTSQSYPGNEHSSAPPGGCEPLFSYYA